MPSLCGLQMILPDLVLSTAWFWLGVPVVNGLCTACLSCAMLSCIGITAFIHHIMGCMDFPTSPSLLWDGKIWLTDVSDGVFMDNGLGWSVTSLVVAGKKMCSNCSEVFLSTCTNILLMLLCHTCPLSFAYVCSSLHHLYGIGMSSVVVAVRFDYYAMFPVPHLLIGLLL